MNRLFSYIPLVYYPYKGVLRGARGYNWYAYWYAKYSDDEILYNNRGEEEEQGYRPDACYFPFQICE